MLIVEIWLYDDSGKGWPVGFVLQMLSAFSTFWMGEGYHQDFAAKNPGRYAAYRIGCGRDAKLKAVWAGR